jgi:hypothetical protein
MSSAATAGNVDRRQLTAPPSDGWGAWLFVRGDQSVVIRRNDHTVVVRGPGPMERSFDFGRELEAAAFAQRIEQRLHALGYEARGFGHDRRIASPSTL